MNATVSSCSYKLIVYWSFILRESPICQGGEYCCTLLLELKETRNIPEGASGLDTYLLKGGF